MDWRSLTSVLFVAAGGGGDAIAAAALSRALGLGHRPPIMTYSWDRLLVDPLPGPRSASDFDGLAQLAPGVLQVHPTSVAHPPAWSALPRLASDLTADLLLLDPAGGPAEMAQRIKAAAVYFDAGHIGLVDVGGDVLGQGGEPNLRSPLADMLALAACSLTGVHCEVFVAGPGIDGELAESLVRSRLALLDATSVLSLGPDDFEFVRPIFEWHPSEASGLLAAAARGRRGWVEIRDAATKVHLGEKTPAVYSVDASRVLERSPAALLLRAMSFADAVEVIRKETGVDEIEYETAKAAVLSRSAVPRTQSVDLARLDDQAARASKRGADFITVRRLAELVGVSSRQGLAGFRELLAEQRPDRYDPPLYRVH